ncbi:MAG: winged helix-turn-helix domain-containing protein [Proteobacteria bacterium]|nr:winged helix-turn-helix domain-containing protein [Pseudomonadota bacterium]
MAKRFSFGPFWLDTVRGTLTRDGTAVAVGQRGLRILEALLEAGGEAVSKEALTRSAWPGLVIEDSNLSVQVAALRKQLGSSLPDGSEWIVTVPRMGYRLPGAAAVEDGQLAPHDHGQVDHGARPSLAVLPFTHLGDDPAQEYLANGVTEALITALTRFRWFSVTGFGASQLYMLKPVDGATAAIELGVRYAVQGSVRKASGRWRIWAQLIEAPSGGCLWAERYDFIDADMFEVQDAIAQQIVGAIEPELLKSAGNLSARRRTGSVSAWDLVAQGSWLFHHVTRPTHFKARELFRQASLVDAELTEAHLWLARVNAGLVAYGWSDDPALDLREGRAAALDAVQMDEKNPYAHYALAIVSNYADEFALALRSAQKAVELSPSFALGHLVHGMAALFSGDASGAVQGLETGLRLNRYDPQNFVWYTLLALAYLFDDKAEAALKHAEAALKVRPGWQPAMRAAAAANAVLGHGTATAFWLQQGAQTPAMAADALQPLWRCNPRWQEKFARWLQDPQ